MGELSCLAEIPTVTIRYYERFGVLLAPRRNVSQRRII
ncbi:MAG: MerR family DNA-binding transcriptional regulator [Pseudanabaena sp.]